ncbi:MAG: glycoside hydrolase family 38 N-terminal domain-containing protein [Anaerolineae bacterium]
MPRNVHVILTTHWDREWIQSFEMYRYRLVRMFDNALDILEREPDIVFVADGQTIMLEDYLAIRPEQQPRLKALAQAGRLVFGPWYVLADQFLECDEAAVRNLLVGTEIAAGYGGAMREGYVPDSFGSIAALPALLNGFGISSANLGRGSQTGRTRRDQHLFTWRWKDGSEVLALDIGYGNGLALSYPDIWRNIAHTPPTPETAARAAEGILRQGIGFPTASIYASAGVDHMELRPGMSTLLESLNATGADRYFASTPERYLAAARQELESAGIRLEVVTGEMRGDAESPMSLQGVLSTDVRFKQANRAAELYLTRLFEPLSAAGRGLAYDHAPVLQRAWKLLLATHPHDSICATCDDNTMDDIHARVRQVNELAAIASQRLLHELIPGGPAAPGLRPAVTLFNGLPGRGSDGFDLLVRVPQRLPLQAYNLVDVNGAAVGSLTALAERQMDLETYYALDKDLLRLDNKRPPADRPDDTVYTLCRAEGVLDFSAASGFRTLQLAPRKADDSPWPASDTHIENDLLALDVAPDGQLTLSRKADGRSLNGLGWFEDMADGGNTYDYLNVSGDKPRYSQREAQVASRLIRRDAFASELEVTVSWELPARLEGWTWPERRVWPLFQVPGRRSAETITHRLVTVYRLRPGLARLEAVTRFDNLAVNHRLRLGFSLPERGPILSGAHFNVQERGWPEPNEPYPTRPMVDYLLLANGLMFSAAGLYEFEARPLPAGGELLVTLCRSVDCIGIAAGVNYEDVHNPLALGPHEIHYALAFADSPAHAARQAAAYLSPLLARACLLPAGQVQADLPAALLGISNPNLVFSACKRSQDGRGAVVRFWNPGGETQVTEISWGLACSRCERVELSEEPSVKPAPRALAAGRYDLAVQPYEIVTLKLHD